MSSGSDGAIAAREGVEAREAGKDAKPAEDEDLVEGLSEAALRERWTTRATDGYRTGMAVFIPPGEVQFERLRRGAVDLHPEEELKKRLEESHRTQTPLRVKTGFDPTAPDLHLGHTVLMEKMAQFQRLGHEVIFLIGDYTALIGDPTGRNVMRPPLSEEEIRENAATYAEQVFRILDKDSTRVEWNSRWLSKLTFNDVIKLAARYNLGRMLERRDFRQRFDENKQIAIHEFLYPLMQAYDSVALEADIELGGHDQIFNLNVGRHIMEQYGQRPQCVLTVGLLVGLDGEDKMSKSKGNHVAVTDKPDDMFGKIMSISDETMWKWYPLLTDIDPDPTDPNAAKKALAEAITVRFHGEEAGHDTRAWWDAGRPPRDFETASVSRDRLYKLVVDAELATSGADARRRIEQGGVRLDDVRITDPNYVPEVGTYMIKVGKRAVKKIVVRTQ